MKSTFLIVFAGSTLLQKAMNPPKDETCLCCFFRYFMFFPLIFNVFISSFRLFSARMSFFRFCSPRTKSSVRCSPEDIICRFQVIGCSDQICQPKKCTLIGFSFLPYSLIMEERFVSLTSRYSNCGGRVWCLSSEGRTS